MIIPDDVTGLGRFSDLGQNGDDAWKVEVIIIATGSPRSAVACLGMILDRTAIGKSLYAIWAHKAGLYLRFKNGFSYVIIALIVFS